MKKYLAQVVLYFTMSWWFFCTSVFMLMALPAKLLVERLNKFLGNDDASKVFKQVDQFHIN